MIQLETINSYFDDYGWNFQPSGPSSILSGWQGEKSDFPLEITLTGTYLRFSVKPLVKLDFHRKPHADILKYLLDINESANFVKLNIHNNGEINLFFDLLTEQVNYPIFCQSLEIIGYYCDFLLNKILKKHERHIQPSTGRYLV